MEAINYRVLAEQLKVKIKEKHGTQKAFAEHIGIDAHNMAGTLSGNPVPYRMRLIAYLLENDLKMADVNDKVTSELIDELVKGVTNHPDAVGKEPGAYPKIKTFFEVNAKKWRRTYFSEVVCKKRFKPTSKLMYLCDHIGINIFEHLKK